MLWPEGLWVGGEHRVTPVQKWRWLGLLQQQRESGEVSSHGVPPTVPPHVGTVFPSFFLFLSHQCTSLPAGIMSLLPPAAPSASAPQREQVSTHCLMGLQVSGAKQREGSFIQREGAWSCSTLGSRNSRTQTRGLRLVLSGTRLACVGLQSGFSKNKLAAQTLLFEQGGMKQ